MSKSTLSSVVSSLVRASMGSTVPSTVPDEDLDRHVAELILKEAKQKAESYSKLGIEAYLPAGPDPNAPRPNKRFLSSIIRSTDDHNKTILRAQALAAQEIKKEREEQERRERRARAEEAVAAERSRRRRRRDGCDLDEWDRKRDREWSQTHTRDRESDWRSSKRVTEGDFSGDEYEREKEHKRGKRRHHSPSDSQEKEDERERDRDRDRKHRRSRRRTPSRERERDRKDDHRITEHNRRKQRRRDSREDDKDHKRRRHKSRSASPLRHSPASNQSQPSSSRKRSRSASLSEEPHSQRKRSDRESAPRSLPSPPRSSQTLVEDGAIDVDSRRASKGKEGDTGETRPISSPRVRSPSPLPPPPPRRARGLPTSESSIRSPSVSPPPLPPAALPSKMDKYFEDSYDPRLDVAPLTIPTVPKTGLINDSEFEAWDAMLELLRQRREDKEEKKRLEKLGFNTSDKKIPTSKLKKYSEGGDSLMDIEYKKKGSVREWDLGKEGL